MRKQSSRNPWWILAVVPLLPVLRLGLFNDDFVGFVRVAPLGWAGVLASFHPHDFEFLRPLGFAFFQLEFDLVGRHLLLYHAVHLALFALAAMLTGVIAGRLGGRQAALWAPALALLYPGRFETVVWLAAIFDLLALVLVALGLVLVLVPSRTSAGRRYALLGVLCFVAPLAKESGYALPLIVVSWELLGVLPVAGAAERFGRCAVSMISAGAAFAIRLVLLGGLGGYAGTSTAIALSKSVRFPEMVLRTLFLPVNPSYGRLSSILAVLCAGTFAAVVAIALYRSSRQGRTALLAGLVVCVAGLLPALVYADPASLTSSQSRYLALAGVGVCLVAATAIGAGGGTSRLMGGALLAAWTGATLLNLGAWESSARSRDVILAGIEAATRTGRHEIWVTGPINDIHGAQLVGGRLAEAVKLAMPGREIAVDSQFLQEREHRQVGPPSPSAAARVHCFRFDPTGPAFRPIDCPAP